MEFDELMKGFAGQIGVPDLAPTEDGTCQVDIDGMVVNFVEVPETRQLVTWAEVGEPPPEGRERLYKALMEAMYMGQATGGSTFALSPQSERIQLFRLDPLTLLDLEAFLAMLEKFVNVLEQWRKLLGEFSAVAPEIAKSEAKGVEESRQFGLGGFMQV